MFCFKTYIQIHEDTDWFSIMENLLEAHAGINTHMS